MIATEKSAIKPLPQHSARDCLRVAEVALFLLLIIITLFSFIWYGLRSIQREALKFDSSRSHWSSSSTAQNQNRGFGDHLLLRGSAKSDDRAAKAKSAAKEENARRAAFVVNLTLEAWTAYQRSAWGFDALQPDSRSGLNLVDSGVHTSQMRTSKIRRWPWQKSPQTESSKTKPNSNSHLRLGRTLVTSMSTLWLMGLHSQFALARHWVGSQLHFTSSAFKNQHLKLNVAEAVQQYLGSFLSLHALTGDWLFLEKAGELADALAPAYRTGTGVPYAWIHLGSEGPLPGGRVGYPAQALGQLLEYAYLERLIQSTTKRRKDNGGGFLPDSLQRRASRYLAAVRQYLAPPNSALHLDRVSADDLVPVSSRLTCLAWTDGAFISGLLKAYLLTQAEPENFNDDGKKETWAFDAFNSALDEASTEGVISRDTRTGARFLHLLAQCPEQWSPARNPFDPSSSYLKSSFDGEKSASEKPVNQTLLDTSPSMKSLSCHFGGLLSLAAEVLVTRQAKSVRNSSRSFELSRRALRYSNLAVDLTESCHQAALATATPGLPPAKFHFSTSNSNELLSTSSNTTFTQSSTPLITEDGSFLGPELAESYFLLWQTTGDTRYQDWAWSYALALHRFARSPNGGFSQIASTRKTLLPRRTNYQPPHLMAATLKYLYLTFAEGQQLPLDRWVFNVAGQPLPKM